MNDTYRENTSSCSKEKYLLGSFSGIGATVCTVEVTTAEGWFPQHSSQITCGTGQPHLGLLLPTAQGVTVLTMSEQHLETEG